MQEKQTRLQRAMAEIEKPDDEFFHHELVEDLCDVAKTKDVYDFSTCLGDTIKEKYETFYVQIHKVAQELIKNGASGYFWIVASPEVTSMVETCTAGYWPCANGEYLGQMPLGLDVVQFKGVLSSKFRLYTDVKLTNQVLIGAGFSRRPASHYGVIKMVNFLGKE